MKRRRSIGALVGGILGIVIGLGAIFFLYRENLEQIDWYSWVGGALVVGGIGALLGSISGLSRP
jgi:hypothetical protein